MMSYEDDWNSFGMGSLDDGTYYDDGDNDFYLGDPEEDYPRGYNCE